MVEFSRLSLRSSSGAAEMQQAAHGHRIYWVHVIWIVNLFVYLVIAWWISTAGATSSRGIFIFSSSS